MSTNSELTERVLSALLHDVPSERRHQARMLFLHIIERIHYDTDPKSDRAQALKGALPMACRAIFHVHPADVKEFGDAAIQFYNSHPMTESLAGYYNTLPDPEAEWLADLTQKFVSAWEDTHTA